MVQSLSIFTTDGKPFPLTGPQAILTQYSYTAQRMGGTPSLTGSFTYDHPLDSEWTGKEYVIFEGEKYYILNTPSSSKDNVSILYKHDVSFVTERIKLENEFFYDAISDQDAYIEGWRSNTDEFSFWGDIEAFVYRFNIALKCVGLSDRFELVIDEKNPETHELYSSEEKEVSFSSKKLAEALQVISTEYNLAYYFTKPTADNPKITIHVGYTEHVINEPFAYSKDKGLLSIQKANSNSTIINRICGHGSSENIPYYYPNKDENEHGDKYVPYMPHLMPSFYRESTDPSSVHYRQRYWDAINGAYEYDGCEEFSNEYTPENPHAGRKDFEDIKPSITGMFNKDNIPLDRILDIAFDEDDNDNILENGEYEHSYFYVKLAKTNSSLDAIYEHEYEFNLFDQALESDTAKISFTSGECASCSFEIGVSKYTTKDANGKVVYKFSNPVQVDGSGYLVRGNYAERVDFNNLQERQQRTHQIDTWIALKKDNTTRTIVMPNIAHSIKPKENDRFVITGIKMPEAYIRTAEHRLDEALVKYMAENNMEKYNFSIKFSRIYLENHPEIARKLNENARLTINYDGKDILLYVTSYSVKVDGNILQEISVELAEEVGIAQSALATKLSEMKADIMGSVAKSDVLAEGSRYFLRRDVDDATSHKLGAAQFKATDKVVTPSLETPHYSPQTESGAAVYDDQKGTAHVETDYLLVRNKAVFNQLEINKLSYSSGDRIIGHAGNILEKVVPITGYGENAQESDEEHCTHYRCFFKVDDGETEVMNCWVLGDLARSQTFNIKEGVYENVKNSFYWRLVAYVGYDYVDLSKSDCAEGSDAPMKGDEIVQMGSKTDQERMGGIIFQVSGGQPSIKQYDKVNSYHFGNDEMPVIISPSLNKFTGDVYKVVNGKFIPPVLDLGEWNAINKYSYMNEVSHNGSIWRCIYDVQSEDGQYLYTTEEPSLEAEDWVFISGTALDPLLIDFFIDGVKTTYGMIGYQEAFTLSCVVNKGFSDITSKVTNWSIKRDTGNANDDTRWNNEHLNFNGTTTILGSDILDDTKNIFTIAATINGNKIIAELEI